MKYHLQKIEWISKPGATVWRGWVGEYILFEILRDYFAQTYSLESVIATTLEDSNYTFITFQECADKAEELLCKLLTNLLVEEKVERIKLNEKPTLEF